MPLKPTDLNLKNRLPEWPKSVPVFELHAPSLDERRAGIERLTRELKLGEMRTVELDHGVLMASSRGEVEYFHASGSIWGRDATAVREHRNELRKWDGLEKGNDGSQRVALNAEASRKLIGQAQALFEISGFSAKGASATDTIALNQVAHLDAKGKETEFGAGQAVVKRSYTLEGLSLRGAGAKTLALADPSTDGIRTTSVFHAWRDLGRGTAIQLPEFEKALSVGVLTDPELDLYHSAGHTVAVRRLELVYLALPATMRQSHLIPAFQIEGEVSDGKRGAGFRFARFHHAVPPETYAQKDLYGPYLTVNPDGISPLKRQQKR
jgi:hypothetical protein